jgi:hypothetical protein
VVLIYTTSSHTTNEHDYDYSDMYSLLSFSKSALASQVDRFKKLHEDAKVVLLPVRTIYGTWAKDVGKTGFANVTSQCYNNTEAFRTQPSVICALPRAVVCSVPETYLYWVIFPQLSFTCGIFPATHYQWALFLATHLYPVLFPNSVSDT